MFMLFFFFFFFFFIVGCNLHVFVYKQGQKYDLNHHKVNYSNFANSHFAACNVDQFHAKLEGALYFFNLSFYITTDLPLHLRLSISLIHFLH